MGSIFYTLYKNLNSAKQVKCKRKVAFLSHLLRYLQFITHFKYMENINNSKRRCSRYFHEEFS